MRNTAGNPMEGGACIVKITAMKSFFSPMLAIMALLTSCGSPAGERPVYRVQKHAPTPQLTGRAGDPAWQAAGLLTDFRFPWQDRPAPATAFRALWNEEFLSFQFVVRDDDIVLGEGKTQEEAVLGSDRVELFFAADPEMGTWKSDFLVNLGIGTTKNLFPRLPRLSFDEAERKYALTR